MKTKRPVDSSVCEILRQIYRKHLRDHPENPDSGDICCMWSTHDPPDFLEGSPPIRDIEEAFGISLDEEDAIEIYDMRLVEAARRIVELLK